MLDAFWRFAHQQCAEECVWNVNIYGACASLVLARTLGLAQLVHLCQRAGHLCKCFCCVRSAVRAPQQGEPAPPEHKAAVRLAALVIAADAAVLATVTSAPGSFAPADGLLDAADALAAAERAGEWLCSPLLWQASCARCL